MKKVVVTFVFVFTLFTVFGQAFSGGLTAGLGGNQIDGDKVSGFNKLGFLVGVYVETNKDLKSALRIETHYIGKGSVNNLKYADGSVYQAFKVSLHYLEMPILYRYRIHEKFSASVGLAPAFLMKSKVYVDRRLVDTELKSIDIGFAAQTDFYLLNKLPFTIRYSHSILPILTNTRNWYNSSLTLGVRYTIK